MAYCPKCENEYDDGISECPICHHELEIEEREHKWVMIGSIEDKLSADFAREVLSSYDIPSVVISKSGYFGQVGLTFNTFYKSGSATFDISVPGEYIEDAVEIVVMAVGDKWQRKGD